MRIVFFVFTILSLATGLVASIMITAYVSRHGTKINNLLCRINIFRYVSDYKNLTTQESGKAGLWYEIFIWAMTLAVIFATLTIIVK
jgi:hypothetical protein